MPNERIPGRKVAADYDPSERKRQFDEPPRSHDERSEFERDQSRIIHSAAFRRLQGKTQVFGLGGSDFFRTRLTHSLEVAQIGKGIALRCKYADPDLVEAVCLAHDLGHPPFGHAGEEELHSCMKRWGGFEANAQNLRIIQQLEVKSSRYDGLNLTRATIDGLLKYKKQYRTLRYIRRSKFFYNPDASLVKWACEGNKGDLSFECQIMDWADDIAYSVHDLEDGIRAGMISEDLVQDSAFTRKVKEAFERKGGRFDYKDYASVFQEIQKAFSTAGGNDNNRRERARKAQRKSVMADLINSFIDKTGYKTNAGKKPTRYQYSLDIPPEVRNECYLLKQVVWEAIINDERIATLERKAKTIVRSLFKEFTQPQGDTRELFPRDFRERLDQANTDADKARVACDYIAGMTDTHAFRVYSRLREPELTSIFEIL
jgi:dGTPase